MSSCPGPGLIPSSSGRGCLTGHSAPTYRWRLGENMTHTVGLIHAVIPAMPPVRDAFARLLPDVRVLNLLDEALLKEAERLGGIGPALVRRMTGLVALHEAAGAELVMFTCNAYSPY